MALACKGGSINRPERIGGGKARQQMSSKGESDRDLIVKVMGLIDSGERISDPRCFGKKVGECYVSPGGYVYRSFEEYVRFCED